MYHLIVLAEAEMDYIAFPLRIEATGALARSGSAEENLLRLLRIMLMTPTNGWPGNGNFGMRDALGELAVRGQVRLDTVRRINEALRELGIDWVEVKMIEPDSASDVYEPAYLLTLSRSGQSTEVQQIKL